jgi:hypothetical protein
MKARWPEAVHLTSPRCCRVQDVRELSRAEKPLQHPASGAVIDTGARSILCTAGSAMIHRLQTHGHYAIRPATQKYGVWPERIGQPTSSSTCRSTYDRPRAGCRSTREARQLIAASSPSVVAIYSKLSSEEGKQSVTSADTGVCSLHWTKDRGSVHRQDMYYTVLGMDTIP